ncbi:MAG: YcaQ family DNA glycosylase [Candidatus Bathyarchaeota archaeon]|nr:MAG: YcaQ family DNA glycosylase [Candidatus Bathyarchaeota archaeon]
MASLISIPKEEARRFLVSKQLFLSGRGKGGSLEATRQLECIQRDPINVVHRNHHLVLHDRVIDYEPSFLTQLLYKEKSLFEYWCNAKSIIPSRDLPYFRFRMKNPTLFHSPFYERIKRRRGELRHEISLVLSEIQKHGPLSAKELQERLLKRKQATHVLNLLWDLGELMIHHVDGNARYYDLAERVLPCNEELPSLEEYRSFMVKKYMKAYGLVDVRDWRFGWLSMKAPQRRDLVSKMEKTDELTSVKVENVKHTYYALAECRERLEAPSAPVERHVLLIPPLDNLLWNRRLLSEIFDFNYSWEVYKVPDKRIYGYYVMPILNGTSFVGRLDPKLDRKSRRLIVNSLILEKEADPDFLEGLAETLRRFLKLHNARELTIGRTEPTGLKGNLMRELKKLGPKE